MWGFAWLFWLAFFVWMITSRRRRWRRYAMMGPGWWGYAPDWSRRGVDGAYAADRRLRAGAPTVWRDLEEQRSYVDALETRVADLEARLDFTERLLAERRETSPATHG